MENETLYDPDRKPEPKNTSDPRLADLCFEKAKAWEAYDAAHKTFCEAVRALDNFLADVTAHQVAPKG